MPDHWVCHEAAGFYAFNLPALTGGTFNQLPIFKAHCKTHDGVEVAEHFPHGDTFNVDPPLVMHCR